MANDLISRLQTELAATEVAQKKANDAAAKYQARHDAAQAAFDKEVASAKDELLKAQKDFTEHSDKLNELQKEMAGLIGTFANSRVTVSQ